MASGLVNNRPEKILTIQAARGFAAIFVVFAHTAFTIAKDKYLGFDPFNGFWNFGYSGVPFFFVISGFVIFFSHWSDAGNVGRLWNYVKKRLLRIYPLYWVTLLFVAPPILLKDSGAEDVHGFGLLLSSILLVHISSAATILTVAWTLYHEILFYLFYCCVVINKRFGVVILFSWFMGCLLSLLFNFLDSIFFKFYFSPLNVIFFWGHCFFIWIPSLFIFLRSAFCQGPSYF
ncbi:acyltransferase [Robbsia sp. KACC 23696]|uniref:acyltransferase family protein n=1 Tax=Robbsia sp. KACC 23696 TaxID=3149231 RepID=UPI00325B8AF4